jgi:hypothetical protein
VRFIAFIAFVTACQKTYHKKVVAMSLRPNRRRSRGARLVSGHEAAAYVISIRFDRAPLGINGNC